MWVCDKQFDIEIDNILCMLTFLLRNMLSSLLRNVHKKLSNNCQGVVTFNL